jgi:hypothetical protein
MSRVLTSGNSEEFRSLLVIFGNTLKSNGFDRKIRAKLGNK